MINPASVSTLLPPRALCRAVAIAHRRFEPEMVPIVSACDPDGVAVDVGAWLGPWSYWLSRRVESVVCYEPNPSVAELLRRSTAANVQVRDVALSDRPGKVRLSMTGEHHVESGRSSLDLTDGATRSVDVISTTLDAEPLDRVRLVKIDVEGHELAVLRGAFEVIDRWHPVIVVEVEARFGDVRPVFDLLGSLGYRARVFMDGRWTRTGGQELQNIQRRGQPTGSYLSGVIHKGNGYVNNVVFAHAEGTWVPW